MLGTARRAFSLVGKDRRRKFALIGIVALLGSILEAASAALVFVLVQFVLTPGRVPALPLVGDPRRFFPDASYESLVLWFAIVFAVFFVIRGMMFLAQQYAVARVSENTGAMLAHRLLDGYLSMPYEFHLNRNSAEVMRNAYDSVQQVVNAVLKPVATLFAEVFVVAAILAVLLAASVWATGMAIVLLAIAVLVTFVIVQPRLKRLGAQRQLEARSVIKHIQQGIGGIRDIKVLGRERTFANSFRRARNQMARIEYVRSLLVSIPRLSIETIFLGFVLFMLVWAVVQDSSESILPTLGLFAYAGMRLQPSVQRIAHGLNNLRFADAAVEELSRDFHLLETYLRGRDVEDDRVRLPFEREIVFADVSFRYHPEVAPALTDIDLAIRRGEAIGIAGRTGGGKTTLIDLLCGLLLPTDGRVTVDGLDVAANARSWQRNIGVVHQTSFLTDDSVRNNIAFGIPPERIDDEAIWTALEMAELADFVRSLPGDVDTVVGERGVRLSGGQRQRVALARALYTEPRLLILDEGTSALDNRTEAKVISNLRRLPGDTTLVIVAHRLTTIARCDRIVFLEDGQISGIGSYEELRETNPGFRAMAV